MRTHDEFDHGEAKKPPERAEQAAEKATDKGGAAAEVLRLQSLAGNRGVTAMLRQDPAGEREENPGGAVADVLGSGGGRPLDEGVRTDMEGRLGQDFSDVRVHTGETASGSAKSLGASAYTVGRDVVFQGDWDPGSDAGKKTLAHELTHVAQQAAGPVDGTETGDGLRVSDPGDRFEQEAERSADAAMSAPAPVTPAGPSVQRQEAPPEEEEEMSAQTSVQREAAEGEEEEEAPPA